MGSGSGGQAAGLDSSTVRQLQQALKGKGHDPGPIDGMMGSQTEAALRDFQRAEGIDASGQPNARTLSALGVTPQGSRGIGGSNGGDRPGASGTTGSGSMSPQNSPSSPRSGGSGGSSGGSGGSMSSPGSGSSGSR
jgi:peptidoglycan hydrolase-like protein with peptidoglycan-binding domain